MWYPANIYPAKEDFAMNFTFGKQVQAECNGVQSYETKS